MNKRGQVTIFIILGIVIVAIILLVLYGRQTVFFSPTPENLQQELISVQDHVISCLGDVAPGCIEKISMQGGYYETPSNTYRLWNDTSVSYLCYNKANDPRCINRALTLGILQGEIKKCIDAQLGPLGICLNVKQFESFGKPVKITAPQQPSVNVEVGQDNVLLSLDYPIEIESTRDETKFNLDEPIELNLAYPLGRLYDLAVNQIVDAEAQFGDFEQFLYMITKKGQFIIYKDKPYPDKLYRIKTRDHPLLFQFYIEGEPS
jgi:hypothetical protein